MNRLAIPLLMATFLLAAVCGSAAEHGMGKMNGSAATIRVEPPAKCSICGMDRRMFAYSRALVTFEDGAEVGTCSIRCAHEAVDKQGKTAKSVQVADYISKQLLDAKKAVWVIGGSKPGVMSYTATWAFANRTAAERFIKEFGGRVAGFDEAVKAAAQ